MSFTLLAGLLCAGLTALNLVSLGMAAWRIRRVGHVPGRLRRPPPVTIIRPICGLDAFTEETLASGFRLEVPVYELVFCFAHADDPAAPLVRRLMAAHPHVPAHLLIGDDRISDNPKLNNCLKGWEAVAHEWVILADSNLLMPTDYVQQLMAGWRETTGLVCSTPIGSLPDGFWAEVECAFLNTLQARWQYVGESLGLGFAQGKSMLWRRSFLNAKGGLRALASDIAEDAAATKLVRAANLRVHLVTAPFRQPLGLRSLEEVWARQLRWARLRRVTFPAFFAPEIMSGAIVALAAGAVAAAGAGWSVPATLAALLAVWYAPEAALAASKGWHVSWRQPLACLVRDFLIPALWVSALTKGEVVWRGNPMLIEPRRLHVLEEGSSRM